MTRGDTGILSRRKRVSVKEKEKVRAKDSEGMRRKGVRQREKNG